MEVHKKGGASGHSRTHFIAIFYVFVNDKECVYELMMTLGDNKNLLKQKCD